MISAAALEGAREGKTVEEVMKDARSGPDQGRRDGGRRRHDARSSRSRPSSPTAAGSSPSTPRSSRRSQPWQGDLRGRPERDNRPSSIPAPKLEARAAHRRLRADRPSRIELNAGRPVTEVEVSRTPATGRSRSARTSTSSRPTGRWSSTARRPSAAARHPGRRRPSASSRATRRRSSWCRSAASSACYGFNDLVNGWTGSGRRQPGLPPEPIRATERGASAPSAGFKAKTK